MSDGHQILGPYTFEEVIGASDKASILPSFQLLSKRGFSEWYDRGDLKDLYHTDPQTQWDSEEALQGGVSKLSKSWQKPLEKISEPPASAAQSLSQKAEKEEAKEEAKEANKAEQGVEKIAGEIAESELKSSLSAYSSNPLSGMNQPFASKTLGHWYMAMQGQPSSWPAGVFRGGFV